MKDERLIRDEESIEEIETEILCIVDRSGSMRSIVDDAVGGFNQFLADQRELPDKAFLTLVRFDDEYEVVCESVPIQEMEDITIEDIKPRGNTALIDAIGKSLVEAIPRFTTGGRNYKVIVVIITDGYENASTKYSLENVKELVSSCREYAWEFLFLGANIDSFQVGASFGMAKSQSVNYDASGRGIQTAYSNISSTVGEFRTGNS
jgi:Mg-chelatase subunit ChlD